MARRAAWAARASRGNEIVRAGFAPGAGADSNAAHSKKRE